MKYEHLSQCVGKTLTKIVEPFCSESVVLVFADAWTIIEAEADDDEAHIDSPYHKNTTRLVYCGYEKSELVQAGILSDSDIEQIKADRAKELQGRIFDAEQHLEHLRAQARLEGLT